MSSLFIGLVTGWTFSKSHGDLQEGGQKRGKEGGVDLEVGSGGRGGKRRHVECHV